MARRTSKARCSYYSTRGAKGLSLSYLLNNRKRESEEREPAGLLPRDAPARAPGFLAAPMFARGSVTLTPSTTTTMCDARVMVVLRFLGDYAGNLG